MASLLAQATPARLERSCDGPHQEAAGDWIRSAPARPGFERCEAFFAGHAFDPHRHDSYAIAITLGGLQAFGYRGAEQRSLPGQAVVLHPDEKHDGHAGSEVGFRYRILYIAPRLIRDALGDEHPLPFVPEAVSNDSRLIAALRLALDDFEELLEELQVNQIVLELAEALVALDSSLPARRPLPADHLAVERARALLEEKLEEPLRSEALEAATGLDRYSLARQFRAALGTSPYRYRVMRRVDRARRLIEAGQTLSDAALASGFADQSHMTRHFRKAYGLPPGRWAAMTRADTLVVD